MDHPLTVADLEPWGHDLQRPECVLGVASGEVFVSDWRGGVTAIAPDGSQTSWLADGARFDLRPNGVSLELDGSFLLANLGTEGGVWHLRRDGFVEPFLTELDDEPLPPVNFVTRDRQGRVWLSVSTRQQQRLRAWQPGFGDGFVVLADGRGARIVADGLRYTNEVKPDPSGRFLYVVETCGQSVLRFPIHDAGTLGAAETVVTLPRGSFPDGIEFDAKGGLWVTTLVTNSLLRLHEDRLETIVEEVNAEHVEYVATAFEVGRMTADHLGPIPGTTLQHVTSVGFAGPDRRTACLGSLHAPCLYRFTAPVAGAAPPHWR